MSRLWLRHWVEREGRAAGTLAREIERCPARIEQRLTTSRGEEIAKPAPQPMMGVAIHIRQRKWTHGLREHRGDASLSVLGERRVASQDLMRELEVVYDYAKARHADDGTRRAQQLRRGPTQRMRRQVYERVVEAGRHGATKLGESIIC